MAPEGLVGAEDLRFPWTLEPKDPQKEVGARSVQREGKGRESGAEGEGLRPRTGLAG